MSAEGHEIVIIRHRGGDDHDEHHGGVWKVAFADFMTAMMAFFLVLWLINASNKETRVAVAAYFNPIKLVDSSPLRKGLREGKDSVSGGDAPVHSVEPGKGAPSGGKGKTPAPGGTDQPGDDAEWLNEPMRMLDTLEDPEPAPEKAEKRRGSFRDPFRQEVQPKPAQGAPPPGPVEVAAALVPAAPPPAASAPPPSKPSTPPAAPSSGPPPPPPREAPDAAQRKAAEDVGRELASRIAALVGPSRPASAAPKVEVEAVSEGLLISLTDHVGYGMFKVGSAEPGSEVLKVIRAVAEVLRDRPGSLIVRGHTDARPYRTRFYDNWQLSGARAHLAQYMLIRGGTPAARIVRVEAHADRLLRNAADPQAPENRRIEILLLKPSTP